jgi:hypothetical protein
LELSGVEIFGYCASLIIAFSLTRSSIIKLRWYNLFGASCFCVYGIIISAYPVAVLNGVIALTNYVDFFLEYHRQDIKRLFPRFMKVAAVPARKYFFLTERTEVVGMLSGFEESEDVFIVDFDFVIPAYRDCRLGHFTIGHGQQLSKIYGYGQIVALADSIEHEIYLTTIGFTPKKNGRWTYDNH